MRQAAPLQAFTRKRAQLATFTNKTKAAHRPGTARDRELLHVLQHPRQPHKLGGHFTFLRLEAGWLTSNHAIATVDLPFTQLGERAVRVHAETQPWCLGYGELWVQFVPVQLVCEVFRARDYFEQRLLRYLGACTDDIDGW